LERAYGRGSAGRRNQGAGKQIAEMKAAMPAHESSGAHTMKLLNLEDELDEKSLEGSLAK